MRKMRIGVCMVYMISWLDYVRTVVGSEAEAREKAQKLIDQGWPVAVADERGELLDLQVNAPKASVWIEARDLEEPIG